MFYTNRKWITTAWENHGPRSDDSMSRGNILTYTRISAKVIYYFVSQKPKLLCFKKKCCYFDMNNLLYKYWHTFLYTLYKENDNNVLFGWNDYELMQLLKINDVAYLLNSSKSITKFIWGYIERLWWLPESITLPVRLQNNVTGIRLSFLSCRRKASCSWC